MKVAEINDSRVPSIPDLEFSRISYFGYINFNIAWLKPVFLSRYVHKLFRSNVPTPNTCAFVNGGVKEGDTSAPSF